MTVRPFHFWVVIDAHGRVYYIGLKRAKAIGAAETANTMAWKSLRKEYGLSVIKLSHEQVKTIADPSSADYDPEAVREVMEAAND